MRVGFELLIKRRPLSVQAEKGRKQAWIEDVRRLAKKEWNRAAPLDDEAFAATLVFLYDSDPIDVDNIIKPILDALNGVVYPDDVLITDVAAHRRQFADEFDFTRLPKGLITAIRNEKECVYVRILAGANPVQLAVF